MPVVISLQPVCPQASPDCCTLEHPLFSRLGEVLFRPAEADGAPSLVMPLGRGCAALPLRSLQVELCIMNDSPDGRMLALIARSLDFVADLRLGDPLPVEVLGGTASWQPSAAHQQLAASRMKLQLISQLGGNQPTDWSKAEPRAVLAAAAGSGMRLRLQEAYVEAAARLGLPDPAAAVALAEAAAYELGFVEALRDRLLRRVESVFPEVAGLNQQRTAQIGGAETLVQVKVCAARR